MINNPVIFYIASALILGFACSAMFLKNIIYSLLCAIIVFFSASIIFYILGSEYNAIIQAAIYGFAVPVIIGLSIMFSSEKGIKPKESVLPLFILIASVLFVIIFVDTLIISLAKLPNSFHFMKLQQLNAYDIISAFAKGIFVNYVWAFELISLLLTIIIAGFTMLNKKGLKGKN